MIPCAIGGRLPRFSNSLSRKVVEAVRFRTSLPAKADLRPAQYDIEFSGSLNRCSGKKLETRRSVAFKGANSGMPAETTPNRMTFLAVREKEIRRAFIFNAPVREVRKPRIRNRVHSGLSLHRYKPRLGSGSGIVSAALIIAAKSSLHHVTVHLVPLSDEMPTESREPWISTIKP